MVDDPGAEREALRIAELLSLDVAQSELGHAWDDVARAAAALTGTPSAMITIVGSDVQYTKASYGINCPDVARAVSFCSVAIDTPERVMIVPDATQDVRFAANPLVVGPPGIRFYAGAPIITRSGHAIGALCAIDSQPRGISAREIEALRALADFIARSLQRPLAPHVPASGALGAVASFGWDCDGRVTRWTEGAHALVGWTAADVIGRFPRFVLEDDLARFRADCVAALDGDLGVVQHTIVVTADGRRLQAAISASRDVAIDGATAGGLSTIEPLAPRLSAQRRLAMLESLVRNGSDALVVTAAAPLEGVRNRIVFVNEAFTKMTGYREDELLGKTPAMLQGPLTDAREIVRMAQAVAKREPMTTELVNYRKDGSTYSVHCSIRPVTDADGWCPYFVAVERETTAQRAAERYQAQRRRLLESALGHETLEQQLARCARLLDEAIPGSQSSLILSDAAGRITASFGIALAPEAVAAHALIAIRGAGPVGSFALRVPDAASLSPEHASLFDETVLLITPLIERERQRTHIDALVDCDQLMRLPNRHRTETIAADAP